MSVEDKGGEAMGRGDEMQPAEMGTSDLMSKRLSKRLFGRTKPSLWSNRMNPLQSCQVDKNVWSNKMNTFAQFRVEPRQDRLEALW